MKPGMWMLTACCVLATALTIGIAQDRGSLGTPFDGERGMRTADSRKLRVAPAALADKTTIAAPTRIPAAQPDADAPAEFPNLGAPVKPAPVKPAVLTKASVKQPQAARHPLADEQHPLVHADHQQAAGTRGPQPIKQVTGTKDGESPFSLDISPSDKAFDASPSVPEIVVAPRSTQNAASQLRRASYSTAGAMLSAVKTSSLQAPNVTARWTKKADLNVGQPCECSLVVTNSGKAEAGDVVVEVALPATVRVTKAAPTPDETKETAIWRFASLKAGETKTIQLTLIPSRRGDLQAKASVRFTGLAAGSFSVKEPMLKVELSGPATALVGDSASQFITVSNPGTGVAKNVSVEATIPAGLEHPRGERLVMDIGSLNPGESRKVRLSLNAVAGGDQKIKVKATAVAALAQVQERVVKVAAPSLKAALSGPGLRYVGRNAVYTLKVTNDGSVATNNVRLVHKLPEGFTFVKTDNGGSYEAGKRTVSWFVGRVEPGQSVAVKTVLTSTKLGDYTHLAGALSEQGVKAEASCNTKVDGTASLMLEIVDLDDPVEVGTETAYEVRVRNDGSKSAGNVKIACELAKGVELITAKGPTTSAVKDGQITFEPLATLEPGKTVVYRVHVKGKLAGDLRFRAHLSSDANSKTLTYDELTKFYGEK